MSLKICIVSINYFPEPTGISVYSTGMAEFLAVQGHSVRMYTSFSYYPAWKKSEADRGRLFAKEVSGGVTVLRNYIYVPQKPTAIRRIIHELSFTISSGLRYLAGPSSDVTVVVAPPLLLGVAFGILARLKRSKLVLHVQDLQPDAAIDLGMLKPGALTDLLFRIERWGYRLADRVSTISQAMLSRINSKGVPIEKTLLFKNWANDELIRPMHPNDSLRPEWELGNSFVVLYSGNMGVKQGLGMMLDAASRLRHRNDILFLIVGDGGEKDFLVERASREGLVNVRFMPPVAKQDLARLLAAADVSVITQKAGIDDLVLPSKLGNLLSSLRPVITATIEGSELASIIKGSGCGVVIPPEDGIALADAVEMLMKNPPLRCEMATKGRDFAIANLASGVILTRFEQNLMALSSGN
jgi:colanic acid biosynthesis glycosyl transferase WcaI